MTKLFVVGFPRDMDKTELLELFSLHGLVDLVTIITDKETGVSQGYGFIHMNDQAGAERAIAALNGAEIDDRTISVRIADAKPEPEPVLPPKPVYHQVQKPGVKGKRPRKIR
jgi:RNA recognition motif-containing protein